VTKPEWIAADWPAAPQIKAFTTTRKNGYSIIPYDSFNLAMHVGDDPNAVYKNRAALQEALLLPQAPCWLNQTHSTQVVRLTAPTCDTPPEADASVTNQPGIVCAVLTADCLPILLCDRAGTQVAAIHAGWRGLLNGIIDETLNTLSLPGEQLMAWLGPAIGPQAFGINEDIRQQFIDRHPAFEAGFLQHHNQWHGNLYQLAKINLAQRGVTTVSGGDFCTQSEPDRFFSYRGAKNNQTGRMATLIWIASH